MESTTSACRGLSGSTLKLIAIIAMALDHIAWCLIDPQLTACGLPTFPQFIPFTALSASSPLYALSYLFHLLGRITFPLMLFLLTEGMTHTRNSRRYALNLFIFAFVSEIPFDLAFSNTPFDFSEQNIFFTLFLSLIAMYAIRKLRRRPWIAFLIVALCAAGAWLLHSDYGCYGVLIACVMELLREKKTRAYFFACLTATAFSFCECTALLALPAVRHYNGKRGLRLKYTFYLFYPVHLLIMFVWKTRF